MPDSHGSIHEATTTGSYCIGQHNDESLTPRIQQYDSESSCESVTPLRSVRNERSNKIKQASNRTDDRSLTNKYPCDKSDRNDWCDDKSRSDHNKGGNEILFASVGKLWDLSFDEWASSVVTSGIDFSDRYVCESIPAQIQVYSDERSYELAAPLQVVADVNTSCQQTSSHISCNSPTSHQLYDRDNQIDCYYGDGRPSTGLNDFHKESSSPISIDNLCSQTFVGWASSVVTSGIDFLDPHTNEFSSGKFYDGEVSYKLATPLHGSENENNQIAKQPSDLANGGGDQADWFYDNNMPHHDTDGLDRDTNSPICIDHLCNQIFVDWATSVVTRGIDFLDLNTEYRQDPDQPFLSPPPSLTGQCS